MVFSRSIVAAVSKIVVDGTVGTLVAAVNTTTVFTGSSMTAVIAVNAVTAAVPAVAGVLVMFQSPFQLISASRNLNLNLMSR